AKKARVPLRDIFTYLRLHPRLTDRQEALVKTQLHGRLATPWTCFTVVLIAIPFGVTPSRRNAFVGVASSILICFVYFILQQLGLSLGIAGNVPPWLGAWLPNGIAAAVGIWL